MSEILIDMCVIRRNFPQRREALIERRTDLLCARNLGQMEFHHAAIDILHDIIDDSKEMDIDDSPLANTNRASNRLMDNRGIPMLGQKKHTTAEL
jgi:hypothetical protein